jgi:hypothetical protein
VSSSYARITRRGGVEFASVLLSRFARPDDGVSQPRSAMVCHPERSEGSLAIDREMLRGVYPECNEWAQHDSIGFYSLNSASEAALARYVSTMFHFETEFYWRRLLVSVRSTACLPVAWYRFQSDGHRDRRDWLCGLPTLVDPGVPRPE